MMDIKDALSPGNIEEKLKSVPHWKQEDKYLVRVQTFPKYIDALNFVQAVGLNAEKENHHPDIFMNFKRVTVRYWTHTARGLSALDFKLAGQVEELVGQFYKKQED